MRVQQLPSTLAGKALLGLLLGMALGLLSINVVQALGLNLTVYEKANGAGQDLLGLSVLSRVT